MSKAEIVFMYVTVILGLLVEAVIALGLALLLINGIGLLFESLAQLINPTVGILTIIAILFIFMVYDSANSIEFAELEESEEEE